MPEDHKDVPGLWVNLFSLTKASYGQWKLQNEGTTIFIPEDSTKFVFDYQIKNKYWMVVICEVTPTTLTTNSEILAVATHVKGKHMDINNFHNIIGHPALDHTKKTTNYNDIILTGQDKACEDCALATSKQKNVKKLMDKCSTIPGKHFYWYFFPQIFSFGRDKFWLLVNDCTDKCWSFFLSNKNGQVKVAIEQIKDLKAKHNIKVETIRCDKAGENYALEKKCKRKGWESPLSI